MRRTLPLLSALLALAGCGGDNGGSSIPAAARGLQSIAIDVAGFNDPVVQFRAVGTYADATTRDLTNDVRWSSTVPDKFPITAQGAMTGTNNGGAFEIRAQLGGVSATPYSGNWD